MRLIRLICLIVLMMPFFQAFAQTGQPDTTLLDIHLPPQIQQGFENRYPGLSKPEWAQNGDEYTATFQQEGKTVRSIYNKEGNWVGDYISIQNEDLPTAVRNTIREKGIEPVEAYEVRADDEQYYEIIVTDNERKDIIRLDENGDELE